MKITELVSVTDCPSNWKNGQAWAVTFRTDDGRLFKIDDVQQLNKPELHHLQYQAETHSKWFWEFGAKEIGRTE